MTPKGVDTKSQSARRMVHDTLGFCILFYIVKRLFGKFMYFNLHLIFLILLMPAFSSAIMRTERSCESRLAGVSTQFIGYIDRASRVSKALNWEFKSWNQIEGFNYKEFDPQRLILLEEIDPPENLEGLRYIRKEWAQVESEMPQNPTQQVVVYPLSSSDLTAPLVLFPTSKTIILIDSASAVEEADWNHILEGSSEVEYNLSDSNKAWLDASPTTSSKTFQKIMTSLKFHKPNSSINRITFFYENKNEMNVRIEILDNETQTLQVIFYLSLNIRTLSKAIEQGTPHWSLDILNSQKPNVLMAKASMGELGVRTRSELARDYFLNRIFCTNQKTKNRMSKRMSKRK
jgi:hypothetical protein